MAFEWDDARYFLAVHRTGSLTAAGKQLGVNQSTVSRRMHALEEALGGARLFVQTQDGYFLSPAGERLLPRAARIEDEALALEREATGQEASLCGPVRITGADAFSARVLAPLLADFHVKVPGIDLELVADTRTLSLTKREADLAVRTMRPKEPSLVLRRMCGLASAVYAAKTYPEVDLADLASHPFLGADDATWAEALWLARNHPTARVVFKSNSTEAQLAATKKGMGLGIIPCYVGDPDPELVRILPPEKVVTRDLWLVIHRDLQHSARIRAVGDYLFAAITARAAEFEGVSKAGYASRPKKSSGQGSVLPVETHRLGAAPTAPKKKRKSGL